MSLLLLFRPLSSEAPPIPPIPPEPGELPVHLSGGGGGGAGLNPYLSGLTKTYRMPGMREIIQREDDEILAVIMAAVTKGTLQ
jgi:hypothetical protein